MSVSPTPAALPNAIRVPPAVVKEMFSHLSKNAKLGTEFFRKYDTIQYTAGVPWLEDTTRKWLLLVMSLQLLVWLTAVISTVTLSLSGRLPRFVPAFVAPFLTLHHFVGYLSFARRNSALCCFFCVLVIFTGALQGTELASAIRALVEEPASARSHSGDVVTSVSCILGLFACLGLFFSSVTLFLRMRREEAETRVLIPVETLEEAPNELPFVRWYFSLPLHSNRRRTGGDNDAEAGETTSADSAAAQGDVEDEKKSQ